jgi:glucosamine 6-phosphate synthetase-like amidotransferase/phosphosugar isomerase protein
MNCPYCKQHPLVFTFRDPPKGVDVGGHPLIVAMKCTPMGTGVFSTCTFTPGSDIFLLIVALYWAEVENNKMLEKLRASYMEKIQQLIYELFLQINERKAAAHTIRPIKERMSDAEASRIMLDRMEGNIHDKPAGDGNDLQNS